MASPVQSHSHQHLSPELAQHAKAHWLHHFRLSIYAIAAIASLGGLLVGFDTGVISGAEQYLRKDFALSTALEELVVSAVLIGGIVGAALGGKLSGAIGRKWTIITVAVIFVMGGLLTAFSWNIWSFIAFRIFVGIGLGMAILVVSIYITELSPSSKRGTLVTFNQLALSLGILVAYGIDLLLIHWHATWRLMFGAECIPGSILAIGMSFLPESPRWLASKGKWQEADHILSHVIGLDEEKELRAIHRALATGKKGSLRELLHTGLRMALVVGVGLAFIQQLVGINGMSYYAPTLFKFAGFHIVSVDIIATLAIAVDGVIAKLVTIFLLDRVGRRPLLLTSIAGIAITLIILGFIFAFRAGHAGYLTLVVLLVYILSYGIGLGPLFSLLGSEIFSTRLRSIGDGIATMVNWFITVLVTITFLSLMNILGKPQTFWLYAIFAAAGFIFCWFLVPETKGKSLEQIEHYWQNGRHWS
nr:sugar porter family MFS transporter [Ktedonobacteraceae bacterium]